MAADAYPQYNLKTTLEEAANVKCRALQYFEQSTFRRTPQIHEDRPYDKGKTIQLGNMLALSNAEAGYVGGRGWVEQDTSTVIKLMNCEDR